MSAHEVAKQINVFNIPGWKNCRADEIIVKPLGDGYVNTTLLVEKKSNHQADKGPASLVFKKYGGNKMSNTVATVLEMNCPAIQSLICYELSRLGWGPKLYGVFAEGRIEEYIDCHPLHASEAFEDHISDDFARAYARFHSLRLPLHRDERSGLDLIKESAVEERHLLKKWVESVDAPEECIKSFASLLDFPYEQEFSWICSIQPQIQHRNVFSAMDSNYLNRLVKNAGAGGEGNRCMIIDYDISSYFDRGFDLGGHFVQRVFDCADRDNKLSGLPYPSRDERRLFLSRYLDEASRFFDDFDPQSIDNIDNLELETDFYALFYCLWLYLWGAHFYKIYAAEPALYTLVGGAGRLYQTLKKSFCETYPHLVKN